MNDYVQILPLLFHSTRQYGAMNVQRSVIATLNSANRDYNVQAGLLIDPDEFVDELQNAAREAGLRVPARGVILTALRANTAGGRGQYITNNYTPNMETT